MAEQVEFNCPNCGQLYRLTAEQLQRYAGRTTNCRKCQQPFTFPAAEPEPEPEAEPQVQPPADDNIDMGTAAQYQAPPPPRQPYAAPNQTYVPPQEPQAAYAAPTQTPTMNYRAPVRRKQPTIIEFLTFRAMVTPLVIQIVFWLGVAVFLVVGAFGVIASFNVPTGFTVRNGQVITTTGGVSVIALMISLGYMLVGPIIWRIYCEILIVIFRIHDSLNDIKESLQNQ